jgi:hypothetical protein
MKRKLARVFHALAITVAAGAVAYPGTVASVLPISAIPYLPLALAAAQMLIGERQHKTNPDGTPAKVAWDGK